MPTYTDIGGAVASLRVLDEFTAPIRAALEQIAGLQAAMERFRTASGGMSAPFTRLAAAIARTQGPLAEMAAKLDAMDAPISEAADRLSAVADRTAAIAASASAAAAAYASIGRTRIPAGGTIAALAGGAGSGAGEGGGGRGGGGGFGGEEAAGAGYFAGRPSGVAARVLSIPGITVGAAVYESLKQALTENLALTQSLAAFNVHGAPAAVQAADLTYLHDLARQSAIGTIYSEAETSRAMLAAAQMSGFTGQAGIKQFASIFPVILRAAEVGQMQGLGSIEDNIKAAIGYAHLTQRYTAGQLTPGLDEILAIAERTRTSLASVESTMKYGLPMAVAAGANVDQAAAAIGFLMRAGLGRTSGYALGNMILGTLTAGGPINAQLAAEREKVRSALGEHAAKLPAMTAHVAALKDLGILDKAGNLTVLNKQGGVDFEKLLDDIQRYGAHHQAADLADVLYKAFGIRGMRGATLLALQKELFSQFEATLAGTPGAAAQQAAFAQTPLQEFEQLLARIKDIGNVLGTALLPELGTLLKYLDELFGTIDRWLSKHHRLSAVAASAAAGASVGAVVAGGPGAIVGGGLGALAGAVVTAPGGPAMHPGEKMPGQNEAAAALLGRPRAPQITNHITVDAPFTLTVQGDVLDRGGLEMMLDNWWGRHKNQFNDAVMRVITDQQRNGRRGSVLDWHGDPSTAAVFGASP